MGFTVCIWICLKQPGKKHCFWRRNYVIHRKMVGTGEHHAKWNKPELRRTNIACFLLYTESTPKKEKVKKKRHECKQGLFGGENPHKSRGWWESMWSKYIICMYENRMIKPINNCKKKKLGRKYMKSKKGWLWPRYITWAYRNITVKLLWIINMH
jgi:hypothetical protein